MDSNNSLKLVDNMFRGGKPWKDEHDALSSHWIDPEHVDRFKDDAGKRSTDASNGSLPSTFGNDTDPDWLRVVQDNGSTSVTPEKLPVTSHRHVTLFYLIRSRMDSYYVSVPRDASWVTHGS